MELDANRIARLIFLVLILMSISGWFFASLKSNPNRTLQRALVWLLIFIGLIAGFGLWEDIKSDFTKEKKIIPIHNNLYQINKSLDGHFYVTVEIENSLISFLVDTGATQTILSLNDATRIGVPVSTLLFLNPIKTANGTTYTAKYIVKNFNILGVNLGEKEVQVSDKKLFTSLLGMDIIQSAKKFLISENKLQIYF